MIQKVKSLEAELVFQPLGDGGGLHGAEVEAHILRPTQHAATGVAKDLLGRRDRESRQIPPIQETCWARVGIADQVTVVLSKVDLIDGVVQAIIEAVDRKTGSHRADTT